MNNHAEYFEINGQQIAWGKPFNEVRELLKEHEQPRPEIRSSWQYAHYKCSSILNMPAIEAYISAPFANVPVLRVSYQLSPLKAGFLEKLHTPYIRQLEQTLGTAHKTSSSYSKSLELSAEYKSGAVVYSASWWFGDVAISISVYGGTRNEKNGPSGAGIYVYWYDEISAAKPFREQDEAFESLLQQHLSQKAGVKKFGLESIRPFAIEHYGLPDRYNALKNEKLRAAQMALYAKNLHLTPTEISTALAENEVLYYTIPALGKLFISTKWDTVCIDSQTVNTVSYTKLLRARGPGGHELSIDRFYLRDSLQGTALPQLASLIENDCGAINRSEWYDD